MTLRAERRRETRGNVIRNTSAEGRRAVPGRLVAAVAIRVRRCEVVVVIDVAVGAGVDLAGRRHLVRAKQRPARRRVVEGRRQKGDGIVTARAVRRGERGSRRRMHRVGRSLPAATVVGIQMTLGVSAIGRLNRQIVVVIDVAVGAGVDLAGRRHLVRIRQRKTGCRVIKIRVLPGNRVVAVGTGGDRENRRRRGMLWVGGLLPGGEMAARMSAIGSRNLQVVVTAYVAARTGNIRVPIRQREIDGRRSVVDVCSEPAVEVVTRLAGQWELGSNVVWHASARGYRLLKVLLVTGNTVGRKPLELADRRTLMTILALHGRMGSEQREAVLVVLYLLHGDVPSLHRVALCAVRAHLPSMDVVVAVLAILAHVGEDRFHVALCALHLFVHAPQRVSCLVVIELGNRLDGPPGRGGMAVLARDRERAVRTTSRAVLLGRTRAAYRPAKQHHPEREFTVSSRVNPPRMSLRWSHHR